MDHRDTTNDRRAWYRKRAGILGGHIARNMRSPHYPANFLGDDTRIAVHWARTVLGEYRTNADTDAMTTFDPTT